MRASGSVVISLIVVSFLLDSCPCFPLSGGFHGIDDRLSAVHDWPANHAAHSRTKRQMDIMQILMLSLLMPHFSAPTAASPPPSPDEGQGETTTPLSVPPPPDDGGFDPQQLLQMMRIMRFFSQF